VGVGRQVFSIRLEKGLARGIGEIMKRRLSIEVEWACWQRV
jgi:hypothetical protein